MVMDRKSTSVPASKGHGSLKSRVFRAGSWAVIGNFLSLLLRLFGSLILTRIFMPEVFGILAIATAFQIVIGLLTDIGLRQAIIQSPNGGNPSFLNTAWTVQILRGWLIFFVCAIAAAGLYGVDALAWVPANSVYANRYLPAVIVVTSFSAVIMGFQSMKTETVNRNLDLKRVTLIDLYSQLIGLIVVVLISLITRSIWSYIAGNLVVATSITLLSHIWLSGRADRLGWDRKALQELKHFGKWIFLSSVLGAMAMNGDRFLLAAWVSPAVLGYYSIASNLASVVDGLAGRLYGTVSMPALSEVVRSQPDRLPVLYFRIRWLMDSILIGFAGFLFATGEKIVDLMYDSRYGPSGTMLQWLSFGLLLSRYGLTQSTYLALGRPDYVATINIIKLISLFGIVPMLFYAFGVQGAILGIAFHMAPAVVYMFWFNQRHGMNNSRLEVGVLAMWPIGWVAGFALLEALRIIG